MRLLPLPPNALHGQRAHQLAVPDSVVCFYHRLAREMNRPKEGRALHHRYVLILALKTAVTVCVDNRAIRLNAGEGLLILPFQFHNYTQPDQDKITWMFVTFAMADGSSLEPLRFQVFALTPILCQTIRELLSAYMTPYQENLTVTLLTLLLLRIRQTDLLHREQTEEGNVPDLLLKINQLALGPGEQPSVKDMAGIVGISPSHLRARFRASCGVSLGRHLRMLRLEKARNLLRYSSYRVSDIAEQCGFNSIFSFSRSFRSAYGLPPLAYRHSDQQAPKKTPKKGR